MARRRTAWMVAVSICFTTPATAATLVVDGNGFLTGATGVDVDGTLYDVQFADGTCEDVFGGCDSPADFAFADLESAFRAALSLQYQVLQNEPYPTHAYLTAGCFSFSTNICRSLIPYGLDEADSNIVLTNELTNFAGVGGGIFQPFRYVEIGRDVDLALGEQYNWARFTRSGVPEPATWTLLLLGFGAVGAAMRTARQRRSLIIA